MLWTSAADEHRDLKPEQYEYSQENGHDKIIYNGRLNKSYQGGGGGGVKHRKITPKRGEIFAQPENPRCPVKLFKKYIKLIPKGDHFYKKQIANWKPTSLKPFSQQNVGIHTLQKYMQPMFTKAHINTLSERRACVISVLVTL